MHATGETEQLLPKQNPVFVSVNLLIFLGRLVRLEPLLRTSVVTIYQILSAGGARVPQAVVHPAARAGLARGDSGRARRCARATALHLARALYFRQGQDRRLSGYVNHP